MFPAITFGGNIYGVMGKIRRGGYVFIYRKGDHDPKHVHIFRDGIEIAKWNLKDSVLMKGEMNRKLLKLIEELVEEGIYED